LTKNNNTNGYILDTILNEKEKEYDNFENGIFYILQKVTGIEKESKDNRLQLNSIIESVNTKANNSIGNDSNEDSQISNVVNTSPFEKEVDKEGEKHPEQKVITSLKHMFEKFDAGGETLLSLYNQNDTRKNILNNFFVNLLAWGSYKIGNNYATDLIVAYNAIVKKFPFVNQKIKKILSESEKYMIQDETLISSLKTVLECLTKIQKFYEDNFLSNKTQNLDSLIDSEDKENNDGDPDKNENIVEVRLDSVESSLNELIKDSNEKKNIMDLINEINIGNLFILNCGNEGLYNNEELQMLFMFLINSNFINNLN